MRAPTPWLAALLAALPGLAVLAAAMLLVGAGPVARAWYVAVLTWGAVPIGCAALLILNHLLDRTLFPTRVLEAGSLGLWPFALALLPLGLAPVAIHPWADGAFVPSGPLQDWWFDPTFHALRTGIYLGLWLATVHLLLRRDRAARPGGERSLSAIPAAMVWLVTSAFAAVDWFMALDPDFASAGHGLVIAAHQVTAGLGFAVLADSVMSRRAAPPPPARVLLVGGALAWGFPAYAEYLVIWSGDVPNLARWYLMRDGVGWPGLRWWVVVLTTVGAALALLAPVWRPRMLVRVAAALILTGQMLEAVWHLWPVLDPMDGPAVVLFAAAQLTVVSVLAAGFLWAMGRRRGGSSALPASAVR